MIRAGVGYSVTLNPRLAAIEATEAALRQAGLKVAQAALCFAGSRHSGAYPQLVRAVATTAGTSEVVGCGAMGVIANGREIEAGPSVAVMVLGGDALGSARFFVPQLRGRSREAALELAAAARPHLGANNLLCVFADSYNLDAEPFVTALASELPGVPIVGGGASEDGTVGETLQFCGDVVSSNAVSAMLLTGDFRVQVGAAQACAPLGGLHQVTAVRDNILLELDGRPAFEVFAEATGRLADDLRRAITFIFLGVPVSADAQRLERGKFSVRNVMSASPEHGAIAVAYRAAIGEQVGFVLRDAERSRGELKAMLETFAVAPQPPACGLYFDCISRGAGLYGLPDHDSAYIGQLLPNVPIVGLFTGFEFGPLGGKAGLLQYSGVLALLSETLG